MKKLLALLVIAGMVGFIACGPSQKEKDEAAKKKQDSIDAAAKLLREKDSIANVQKLDSLKKVYDDSIAKLKKPQGGTYYAPKPPVPMNQPPAKPTKPVGKG